MKKIFALLFLGLAIGFIYSCSKDSTENKDESKIDYEKIGQEHNIGLDHVFQYLKENKVSEKLKNSVDLTSLIHNGTIDFLETSEFTKNENITQISSTFPSLTFSKVKSVSSNDIVSAVENEIELTENQVIYLNKLDQIISNLNEGLDYTILKINELENEIASECNSKDAELLLSAASIGRHSIQYWHENYDKWVNELSSQTSSKSSVKSWDWFCDTVEGMGKADLVGGLIGCLGGPAGMVGGACYASACSGTVALIDHVAS